MWGLLALSAPHRLAEHIQSIVTALPVIVFALDRDGVYTLSEGAGLGAIGRRPGEAVGRSIFEIYRDHPKILENIRRALAGEHLGSTVEVGDLAFDCWYAPQHDAGGAVTGVYGLAVEATGHMKSARLLLESEQRWELALRGNNDGLWDWNAGTNEVFFSDRWKEMLGYADSELPNLTGEWEQRLHPEDLARRSEEHTS